MPYSPKKGETVAEFWKEELGITQEDLRAIKEKQSGPQKDTDVDLFGETRETELGTYNREEAVQLAELDLNFLAAMAAPELFVYDFPEMYLIIWQLLIELINQDKKFPQLALGMPRGHAKTTLVKFFILFTILFTKKRFILVISAISGLAENVISDVADMLDQPNIKDTFGNWRDGMEKDTQNLKKFGYKGRSIILVAIGAGGSLRGMNIKHARPDLIIFEDVQTKECAESKVQSDALEKWMFGTAMKAKSPTGCLFLFVGNMYPEQGSILRKLKFNKTWIKFISGAILADGTAIWEELRSLESLYEEFESDVASGHPEIFFSEVLNDTEAGSNTTIDFTQFKPWIWAEEDEPQGKFIVIDPSTGKGLDLDAIGYFEVYDQQLCMRKAIQDHYSPLGLIKAAIVMALTTGTRLIAVEAISYQFTFLFWFNKICEAMRIEGLILVPIYCPQQSKNSRIAGGLKATEKGEIILHPDVRPQVQRQAADWKPLKRDNIDDLLDLIAYAPKVLADHEVEVTSLFGEALDPHTVNGVIEHNSPF